MGSEWLSPFFTHFFAFLGFLSFSSLLSSSPQGQGQTTTIYCKNEEFHSDPVCSDPVQNFPICDDIFQKIIGAKFLSWDILPKIFWNRNYRVDLFFKFSFWGFLFMLHFPGVLCSVQLKSLHFPVFLCSMQLNMLHFPGCLCSMQLNMVQFPGFLREHHTGTDRPTQKGLQSPIAISELK